MVRAMGNGQWYDGDLGKQGYVIISAAIPQCITEASLVSSLALITI